MYLFRFLLDNIHQKMFLKEELQKSSFQMSFELDNYKVLVDYI